MKQTQTTQPFTLVESFGARPVNFPHLAKNARYPDFLYAALRNGRVCGFHRGKPHRAHQSYQTSQEIRGMGHPPWWKDKGTKICFHADTKPSSKRLQPTQRRARL
jgi:hypothetical protein